MATNQDSSVRFTHEQGVWETDPDPVSGKSIFISMGAITPGMPTQEYQCSEGTITIDESGFTLVDECGISYVMPVDGCNIGKAEDLIAICFEDHGQLEFDHTNKIFDTTSHVFQFKGGGILSYAQLADGSFIELFAKKLKFLRGSNGVLLVYGTLEI